METTIQETKKRGTQTVLAGRKINLDRNIKCENNRFFCGEQFNILYIKHKLFF